LLWPRRWPDGQNVSPAIQWTGAPPQAKSFALIVDDPDAPSGLFTHWLLYNIPASVHSLGEAYRRAISGNPATVVPARPKVFIATSSSSSRSMCRLWMPRPTPSVRMSIAR
jgi:hypothetical protein